MTPERKFPQPNVLCIVYKMQQGRHVQVKSLTQKEKYTACTFLARHILKSDWGLSGYKAS